MKQHIQKARKIGGEFYQVKVGWGPGSRWRLEHLNEFGLFGMVARIHRMAISEFGKLRVFAEEQKTVYVERMEDKLKELAR